MVDSDAHIPANSLGTTLAVFSMGSSQSTTLRQKRSRSPSTDALESHSQDNRRKRRKLTCTHCENCGCRPNKAVLAHRFSAQNERRLDYDFGALPSSSIMPDYKPVQSPLLPNPSADQDLDAMNRKRQQAFDLAIAARAVLAAEHTHLLRVIEEEELVVEGIRENASAVYTRLQAAHLQVAAIRETFYLEGFMPRESEVHLEEGAPGPQLYAASPNFELTGHTALSPVHSDNGSDLG